MVTHNVLRFWAAAPYSPKYAVWHHAAHVVITCVRVSYILEYDEMSIATEAAESLAVEWSAYSYDMPAFV